MPIYAYKCDACGHAKDVLQKISDPLLSVCPACGAATFTKQLTAAGFQLKGSGWYVTDFRNGNAAAGKPGEGGNAGDAPVQGAEKSGEKGGDKAGDKASGGSAPSDAAAATPIAAPAAAAPASAAPASAPSSAFKSS